MALSLYKQTKIWYTIQADITCLKVELIDEVDPMDRFEMF